MEYVTVYELTRGEVKAIDRNLALIANGKEGDPDDRYYMAAISVKCIESMIGKYAGRDTVGPLFKVARLFLNDDLRNELTVESLMDGIAYMKQTRNENALPMLGILDKSAIDIDKMRLTTARLEVHMVPSDKITLDNTRAKTLVAKTQKRKETAAKAKATREQNQGIKRQAFLDGGWKQTINGIVELLGDNGVNAVSEYVQSLVAAQAAAQAAAQCNIA